ncbi:ATP-binding protein [Actinomadura rubrisoli]|uniref:ATP-binding protein n=1 Tax=Actinomadura rubrisoli TaxID=2530368 RepID=UPI001FB81947|nr:ATP-binding protein [Actinomadura rubrisoli]
MSTFQGEAPCATEVTDHKVKGQMQLPAGEKAAEDAIKATDRIESGMRLPPGSVIVARDDDRADRAHVTVSDPRAIRRPIGWPGPSRPGGSVDEPLRIGIYQDGDEAEYRFVSHHLQIMGMTGSGKSIGGAWNIVAEIITRTDAAVFSIDVSKDDQTMTVGRKLSRPSRRPSGCGGRCVLAARPRRRSRDALSPCPSGAWRPCDSTANSRTSSAR